MDIITPKELKKKSYGINYVLAGMYHNFEKPYWIFHVIYNGTVMADLFYSIITVSIIVYQNWGTNIPFIIKQINFSLIRIANFAVVLNGLIQCKKMDKLFENLRMFNYTVPLNDEQKKVLRKYDKQFVFVKNFFKYLMYFNSFIWMIVMPTSEIILNELVFKVSKNETTKFSKYIPVPAWHPYNPDIFFVFFIQYFIQAYFTFILTHAVIGLVGSFVDLATFIVASFKVLHISLEDLTFRAYRMYVNEKKGTSTNVNEIKRLDLCDNIEYQDCVLRSLKENIRHHQQLIKVQAETTNMYGTYMLFHLLIAAVFLCSKAVTLLDMHKEGHIIRDTFRFTQAVSGFSTIIFLFCWYGEQISQESSELLRYLYYSSWYNSSPKVKKLLMMMMMCTQKTLTVSCAGLKTLNLITFSEICSATYSYFSVLRSMRLA